MLAYVVRRVVDGAAEPREVTTVLRRVCDESRRHPPELLLLRIKELWIKAAGKPRATRDDRDRRYFALIGEALLLYLRELVDGVRGATAGAGARARVRGAGGEGMRGRMRVSGLRALPDAAARDLRARAPGRCP